MPQEEIFKIIIYLNVVAIYRDLSSMGSLASLVFACILIVPCFGEGDAYNFINRVKTDCEYRTLTASTKLSDYYNSLDEVTDKIDRMNQEYLAENIGFGWDHALSNKQHAQNEIVTELQKVNQATVLSI